MTSLRIVTYNVLYGSEQQQRPWSQRRDPMIQLVRGLAPDVIGLQEALDHQLAELHDGIGHHYALLAEHRGDGGHEENSALFYDTRSLEPVAVTHRWLSLTPQVPGSRSWGTHFPRMFTRAKFRHADGGTLAVITTHLDHEVEEARVRSAELLVGEVASLDRAEPVVLMGDFNTEIGSEPYRVLTASGLRDSLLVADDAGPLVGTFTEFAPPVVGGARIDWILVNDQVSVTSARVVDIAPGGQYPSDHLPVEAVITLR